MSLNGLDDEKVQGALEAAVAEPGGWYGMLPSVYILPVIFVILFHFISNLISLPPNEYLPSRRALSATRRRLGDLQLSDSVAKRPSSLLGGISYPCGIMVSPRFTLVCGCCNNSQPVMPSPSPHRQRSSVAMPPIYR